MDWAAVERTEGELRLWLDDRDRPVTAPCGDDPAAALRGLLLPLLAPEQVLTVIASGWPGAAPVRVPCPPPQPGPVLQIDPQIRLHPLPGLVQDRPVDLIEAPVPLIAGHLAANPDFDGILCLPGNPSAWVQISAAEVVSFRSFMTAGILSALMTHDEPGNDAAFAEAVAQAMSRPAAFAAELSSVRAGLALHRIDRAEAAARMAGLLVGAELAAARPWWLGQNVVVMGEGWLAGCYVDALAAQGVITARADPMQARLAGMRAVRQTS